MEESDVFKINNDDDMRLGSTGSSQLNQFVPLPTSGDNERVAANHSNEEQNRQHPPVGVAYLQLQLTSCGEAYQLG